MECSPCTKSCCSRNELAWGHEYGCCSRSVELEANRSGVMRKDTSLIERFLAVLPPISADCHAVLPWLGLYRGREAVKEFLAHVQRNRAVTPFGRRGVIFEGNKAAAFG